MWFRNWLMRCYIWISNQAIATKKDENKHNSSVKTNYMSNSYKQ